MILLEVKSRKGSKVYNLDHVQLVEFEANSLDLWMSDKLSRNLVKLDSADKLRKRFLDAMKPLYEGRMNNVMGLKLEIDISDLEEDKVPF